MFDSVLGRTTATQGRLGLGAVLSVAAHAAVLAAVIWGVTRPHVEQKRDLEVTFYAAPLQPAPSPPPPPPPPAGDGADPATPERVEPPRPVTTAETLVELPKKPRPRAKKPEPQLELQPEPRPTAESAPEPPAAVASTTIDGGSTGGPKEGITGGAHGGVQNGTPGGTQGGTAPPQNVVIPFGPGMTRPSRIAGRDPQYTREALTARVEGVAIVRCVIKVDGTLTRCRMVKSLPHMDREILAAVSTQRFTPVMFQGRPTSVEYTFLYRFKLP